MSVLQVIKLKAWSFSQNYPKMLLKSEFTVKFQQQVEQVHFFSPTFDEGLMVITSKTPNRNVLYHYNNNQIKFKHQFDTMVFSFAMVTDSQVMVPLPEQNLIFVADLKEKTHRYYSFHHFRIGIACQVWMYVFAESGLFCIKESGGLNDNRLILTYYRHPLPKQKPQDNSHIACFFETEGNQWTWQHNTSRGNSHSMVLWHKVKQNNYIVLRTFDLRDTLYRTETVKGTYRKLKIQNVIYLGRQLREINLSLGLCFQLKKDIFMLICQADRQQHKLYSKYGRWINKLIWYVKQDIVRESTIDIDRRDWNANQKGLTSTSIVRVKAFYHDDRGKAIDSPLFFVDNQKEAVVARECKAINYKEHKCYAEYDIYHYKEHWYLPGSDNGVIVKGWFHHFDPLQIKLSVYRLIHRQMASFHLLANLGQDFDYDLLAQTIKVLDYSQQP